MKKLFRLIVTLLLIAGWGLAASAIHVVWTGSSPVVIPKNRLGVRDTYVDVSAWTVDDVAAHPAVARRLIATGNGDVLGHAIESTSVEDLAEQVEEAIRRGPTTAASPTVADKVAETVEQAVGHVKATTGH